ncbi:MAG TPA: acyltransferase [Bradyrhizobium sp.]|nr:acyltransferase [Bradyrhizobium sp.]
MFIKSEGHVRRLKFLDGLRGWGAVFVLLYHVFSDGLPVDDTFGARLAYLVPFNGTLAVLVFFAVSGFSLSVRYLADGEVSAWLKIAAGRYLRLAIPIFAACLIVHVAMISGILDPSAARLPKFVESLNFDPTIGHLLRFSLLDVFFDYRAAQTYIGPLWTMSIELLGSFIVLLAIVIVRPLPGRSAILIVLAFLFVVLAPTGNSAMLALFPLGAAMADWFNRGWIDAIPKWTACILLLVGCVVPGALPFTVFNWGIIATSALMLGCMAIPQIRSFLSGAFSSELGRISFPLYLMHGPAMHIIGEPLTRSVGASTALRFGIDVLVVVASVGAAYAFLPVNNFAIWMSRQVGAVMTGYFKASTPAPR